MNVRTIGPHRVSNRSLEQVNYDDLTGGATIDMLKTDPPWSEDLMDYYVELRNEQSSNTLFGNLSYLEMLSVLCDVADDHVDGFVLVTTQPDDPETYAVLDDRLHNVHQQKVPYRDDYCGVYIGATDPVYTFDARLGTVSGIDSVRACIREGTDPGGIVCDPMCGKGQVAEATLAEDRVFVGNDFNEQRVADTSQVLARGER